ncbi:uncharacterized protein [Antedon mediterranea]|uniref:uncharacterized protein n=1 Tax=Antedon mediterranea TaxID=105859 RepID=UPI003AF75411
MAEIKTYCRVKPTNKISRFYNWENDKVMIGVRSSGASQGDGDLIMHDTQFSHVFGPTVTQSEIFDVVASNIIEGCLAGYNGTIFAYGQTGSGKTYTIEGSSKCYADRGMAPRALSAVYQCIDKMKHLDFTVHVSYLEIYQETGYDLLNPTARMPGVVAHLPKVSVRDGPGKTCIIRNLSTHLAADENIAQNLLHQGRLSRRVAETPMNQRSSRSHAIFTIYVTAHDKKSDIIRKSKLHLVDLAGSERAAKSSIKGNQLAEVKSINLSLHHLEGVIIALQKTVQSERKERRQRSKSAGPFRQKRINSASSTRSLPYGRRSTGEMTNHRHIPYRNSLLTMILKDSLGGNCLTAMVATLSVEDINFGESLSTCRFSQRVACIKNHASRNEELDDKTIIRRLRMRILELEKEINNLKRGIESTQHHITEDINNRNSNYSECKKKQVISQNAVSLADPADVLVTDPVVSQETRKLCIGVMHGFIGGKIKDPVSSGIKNVTQFRVCLKLLREMLMRSYGVGHRSKSKQEVQKHPNSKSVKSSEIRSSMSPNLQDKKERYVSPFEKKRENAIQKVGARVDRRQTDQKLQQKNLIEYQTNIREQQLMLLKKEINGKVLKLRSKIGRQHTLLHNLKQGLGDDDKEIEFEEIALKQLIKRRTQYESRLQVVSEQLKIINQHNKLQNKVENSSVKMTKKVAEESGKEPFISPHIKEDRKEVELDITDSSKERATKHVRGGSGKVNTRKVLEILKTEEKKQEKIQSVLDDVRFETVNSHLALKEQSTRQKLRELKEKLQQSKEKNNKADHFDSTSIQMMPGTGGASNINVKEVINNTTNDNILSSSVNNAYEAPNLYKYPPESAENKTFQKASFQESVFQGSVFQDVKETLNTSSGSVTSNFSKNDGAQNITITSPDMSSRMSFDSALDSMLKDISIERCSTPDAMITTAVKNSESPDLESHIFHSSKVNGFLRLPHKTAQGSYRSLPAKTEDFSELQQKLSKYLGQSSTHKIRPAMMNITGVKHGSVYSTTSIPSFQSTEFLTSSMQSNIGRQGMDSSIQGSTTTLTSLASFSSDKESLYDRGSFLSDKINPSSPESFVSRKSLSFDKKSSPLDSQDIFSTSFPSSRPENLLIRNENSFDLQSDYFDSSKPTKSLSKPSEVTDREREACFIKAAKENRLRVNKIRQAQRSAAVIQKAWKNYRNKKLTMY